MAGARERLSRIGALSHLTDEQRDSLAACAWCQTFEPSAEIFRHGDPSRQVFAIVEGAARLVRATHFGPYVFAEVGAGDLLGEQGLFHQRTRSGDAVAAGGLDAVVIDTDRLLSVAAEQTRFELAMLWAFWRSLAHKLRQSNRRLESFFRAPRGEPQPAGPVALGRHDRSVDLAARRAVFAEQRLSSMEINFLASLSRHERFDSGEVIFREGDEGDALYLVLDGQVMISKLINGVGEEALAFLGRGAYFGEMALIDHDRRSATAKAHGSAVVLEIHREVVEGLLHIEHVSSTRLLRLLCSLIAERLHESDEKLIGFHLLAGGAATVSPALA